MSSMTRRSSDEYVRGGERGRGIDDAYPEVIGDFGDLEAAGIGEAPPQGFVDRAADALHVRDEVDVDEELPQRGLDLVVEPVQVEDLEGVRGDPARPRRR